MAESESGDCRCSNITIMQLFHQLKQRFPTVPDQIVSKVIEENHHDKEACKTILQNEIHLMQCYPGALISGEARTGTHGPLADHCPVGPSQHLADGPPAPTQQSQCDAPSPYTCVFETPHDLLPTEPSTPVLHNGPLAASDTSNDAHDNESCTSSASSPETSRSSSETKNSFPPPVDDTPKRRPLSLEDKEKLSKVPLGVLVREVLERRSANTFKNEKSSSTSSSQSEKSPSPPVDRSPPKVISPIVQNLPENNPSSKKVPPPVKNHVREELVRDTRSSELPCDKPSAPQSFVSQSSLNSPSNKFVFSSHGEAPSQNLLSPKSSPNTPKGGSGFHSKIDARKGASPTRVPPPRNEYLKVPHISRAPYIATAPLDTPYSPDDYEVAVEYRVQPSSSGDRPFTSVNLTLREPSAHPVPIEISSQQGLTYTTATYDPKKGYQSHLQIRIGPALLKEQRERKDLLERELRIEKEKLRVMKQHAQTMSMALAQKPPPYLLSKLKTEIEQLREECSRLTAAVDMYSEPSNLPLGETDQDFYRNIYTGQRQQRGGWSCQTCTFRNHPLLSVCEQCEIPRLSLGTSSPHVHVPNPLLSNNNATSFSVGETSTSVSRTIAPLQVVGKKIRLIQKNKITNKTKVLHIVALFEDNAPFIPSILSRFSERAVNSWVV